MFVEESQLANHRSSSHGDASMPKFIELATVGSFALAGALVSPSLALLGGWFLCWWFAKFSYRWITLIITIATFLISLGIIRGFDSTACAASTEVVFYQIDNGGHTWPGGRQYLPQAIIGRTSRALDASEVIAQFFLAHARN